jgi:hypothetical protein
MMQPSILQALLGRVLPLDRASIVLLAYHLRRQVRRWLS